MCNIHPLVKNVEPVAMNVVHPWRKTFVSAWSRLRNVSGSEMRFDGGRR